MDKRKPELLAPAGDMERLKMALRYGADAVYLAGHAFGMRAAAGNFSGSELRQAVAMSHAAGTKVYVTCNTLPREEELPQLPAFLEELADAGADAAIVTDLGVAAMVRRYAPKLRLHISTQMGVTNHASAIALHELGADRVVLARELSLAEIAEIRAKTPQALELEGFVHGSMCVSFSGRCLLSNYLPGRDANRGACAQPCRWKYHLVEEKRPGVYMEITEDGGTYIMNARDMCMIGHLPALIEAGLYSFKIEGRMKSAYYTAIVTGAYRHAIDAAVDGEPLEQVWRDEVLKVSHRPYCTGFYFGQPGEAPDCGGYIREWQVAAVVQDCDASGNALLTLNNKFAAGDTLELVGPGVAPHSFTVPVMEDLDGATLREVRTPQQRFRMRLPLVVPPDTILRRRMD